LGTKKKKRLGQGVKVGNGTVKENAHQGWGVENALTKGGRKPTEKQQYHFIGTELLRALIHTDLTACWLVAGGTRKAQKKSVAG